MRWCWVGGRQHNGRHSSQEAKKSLSRAEKRPEAPFAKKRSNKNRPSPYPPPMPPPPPLSPHSCHCRPSFGELAGPVAVRADVSRGGVVGPSWGRWGAWGAAGGPRPVSGDTRVVGSSRPPPPTTQTPCEHATHRHGRGLHSAPPPPRPQAPGGARPPPPPPPQRMSTSVPDLPLMCGSGPAPLPSAIQWDPRTPSTPAASRGPLNRAQPLCDWGRGRGGGWTLLARPPSAPLATPAALPLPPPPRPHSMGPPFVVTLCGTCRGISFKGPEDRSTGGARIRHQVYGASAVVVALVKWAPRQPHSAGLGLHASDEYNAPPLPPR